VMTIGRFLFRKRLVVELHLHWPSLAIPDFLSAPIDSPARLLHSSRCVYQLTPFGHFSCCPSMD
jgi:hypothetical protein